MVEPSVFGFGIGFLSIAYGILLILVFKKRTLGLFDPLNIFLGLNIAPLLSSLFILSVNSSFSQRTFSLIISSSLFILLLYCLTPKKTYLAQDCGKEATEYIFKVAVIIFALKFTLLFASTGNLPIFSEGGSDAYIAFDMENKLVSTFLIGIRYADISLLAFVMPLLKSLRQRKIALFMIAFSVLLGLTAGKKSSVGLMFFAVALGEYLRIAFVINQRKYFLHNTNITIAITLSIMWMLWVFIKTSTENDFIGLYEGLRFGIDLLYYQFAYPYFLFESGELEEFINQYQVNRFTYFFHTALSTLGFPAFSASIGPALNEYQSGSMTGNGILPTFVIEGSVLYGDFMPVYAAIVAVVISKVRVLLINIKPIHFRVIFSAMFLSVLYILAMDALLFMKIIFVNTIFLGATYTFLKIIRGVRTL